MSTIKYKGNTYSGAANITDADHVDYDNTSSGLTATSVQDAIDELSDGAPVVELTLAQYNALTPAEQNNGTVYYITDDNGTSIAEDVMYDNSDSGLTATNVQDAVDELNSMIDDGGTSIIDITQSDYDALSTVEKMDGHIYCITDGTTTTLAEDVGYDNTSSEMIATNVQDAIDEAVSYDNTTSGLTATNVQSALDELNSKIDVTTHIPTIVVSSSVASLVDIKCAKNAFMGMIAGNIKAASASSMSTWTLLGTNFPTRNSYPISSSPGNGNTFFTITDELGNAIKLYIATNGELYGRCYHDKAIDFTIVYMR